MDSTIITGCDSYKMSHFYQDPPYTTWKQSYITARGSNIPEINKVVFFGLQAWIQERLTTPFTQRDITQAKDFARLHGVPFNENGWQDMFNRYGGYLPISIYALPEGTSVPLGTAQVVVENTDVDFPWLPAYVETEMLRAVWYPSTVATISRTIKEVIYAGLVQTCDNPDGEIDFRLHDFGQRGVSSRQSAGLGGMAHLLNFKGTDTTEGVFAAMRFYGAPVSGFSIPAMEHSTVTPWGREGEHLAFANMLEKSDSPVVAFVSDSYDIYNAASYIWGEQLKQKVIDSGKTVVIRPDSGNPETVVINLLRILSQGFGVSVNQKGFRVLNNVRIIQGDGMDIHSIRSLVSAIVHEGFSVENVAFGMGGGLLQKLDRDTFKYAMKTTAATIDNKLVDVFKSPVTDPSKASWKGMIDVDTNLENSPHTYGKSALQEVFRDGKVSNIQTFDAIKNRITSVLKR